MSGILSSKCCCVDLQYTLNSCATPASQVVPRYIFQRCDIYELQTGNPKANCPASWLPNPYFVWLMERPGCSSPLDKVCGRFTPTGALLSPQAMTTDAVNAGYQSAYDPDLPVVNTCQYCPAEECLSILAGPNDILSWLTIDDCCSTDCGSFPRGTQVGCDLLTGNCSPDRVTLSELLLPSQVSASGGGTTTISNAVMTVTGTLAWGAVPSSWTVTNDPAGAGGIYQAEMLIPFSCSYSGSFGCFGGGSNNCSNDTFSQTWGVSGTMTLFARATSGTCAFGQNFDLSIITALTYPILLSGTATYDCDDFPPGAQYEYRGGLARRPSEDLGCDRLIRYGANNYMALAFRPFFIDPIQTGGSGVCGLVWDTTGGQSTPNYSYLEIINPLPNRDAYCT
jgi:hypothetical protein